MGNSSFDYCIICSFSNMWIYNKFFTNFSKKEEQNHAVLADNEKEKTIDTSSYDITISPNAEVISTQKIWKMWSYHNSKSNCTKGNS